MAEELYKKYRPTKFNELIGQPQAVSVLKKYIAQNKLPQSILFTGPPGCGKSSTAYTLKLKLKCHDRDFRKIDCASVDKPLDTIRNVNDQKTLFPSAGPCRIWLFEEIQAFSKAGFAQQAMLDMLEFTPPNVYFFMATTDPDKLLPAIRSRCTEIKFRLLEYLELVQLVKIVCGKEGKELTEKVISAVSTAADGGARKVLNVLDKIIDLKDEQEQLNVILSCDTKTFIDNLGKLLEVPGTAWKDIAELLRNKTNSDAEEIRRGVLGWSAKVLLREKASEAQRSRAYFILTAFESIAIHESGIPQLTRMAYEVWRDK